MRRRVEAARRELGKLKVYTIYVAVAATDAAAAEWRSLMVLMR
jgi:hypothetical protein